jgi:tetratricopeptide (TPR) repeat protein
MSRMRPSLVRCPRPWAVVVLAMIAILAAGACAPKSATAPPPGAPHFPSFIYPEPPSALASEPAAARHRLGWEWLQGGDLRAAERNFTAALKDSGGFYPAEAGLGYVSLARKDYKNAVEHFDRAVAADAAYVPALVGRGEAHLALGASEPALASFEAAVAADPRLTEVRSRIDVLRFRGLQEEVAAARKSAEAGRLDEARAAYLQAIASSPESPFLYRELAAVERRRGDVAAALPHAEKAAELDPTDARALILLGELHEAQGNYSKAAEALTTAVALEPNEALDRKIEELGEKAAFAAMPEDYRTIESAPSVTRAQLAALLGVRLDDLLKRAGRRNAVVITDTRGNWAAPWILAVSRAGLMEVYPNHTFQPEAVVRRADLAAASSRALSLIAAQNPRLAAPWRNTRRTFPDLAPGHLSHPAASLAVEAGVMSTAPDGSFRLSAPATGAEAMAAVKKLQELSGSRAK